MRIVILGLSITSSWGNGHATTYRGLLRGLAERGHDVLFLERDVPWYAEHRDLRNPPFGKTELYGSLEELKDRFAADIAGADVAIVGSYVPQGVLVGEWVLRTARGVTAFYDIDTPVTLGKLARGDYEYISPELVGRYDLYLSFTGGPTLERIRKTYGAPRPRALYCSVDPAVYRPEEYAMEWDLGYLGTYSDDRQPALARMLIATARRSPNQRFVVAGPQYPDSIEWPSNVQRIEHLPPADHCEFYNSQRFTLNVTRQEMVAAGWSPSVRLFEAAACGVPIISDYWAGLETFFAPGKEILLEDTAALHHVTERERKAIGLRARDVVLARHTAGCRAAELERYVKQVKRNDQVAADSPRRNGYGWSEAGRPDARSTIERGGTPTGGPITRAAQRNGNRSDLLKPTRTGARNGGAAGTAETVNGAGLGGNGGTRLRRVDGSELP